MRAATAPEYRPGEYLPGTKYRVVRKLAAGGMGVVLEVVKDPQIRGVAKLMGSEFLADAGFRKRFLAEARILAEMEHPNIVRVFDYDALPDGRPFFVMELLRGKPLDEILDDNRTVPPRVAYRIVSQLLAALECAHQRVVHRDVKPGNLFVHKPKHGPSVIKLLDFGVMAAPDKRTIMAGTHGYMAPEQLRSDPVTARTDVYASAVVLYEMLVGHGPFPLQEEMGSEAVARATLEAPAPRITRYAKWVPESVADAIASALEKDPALRPASARAFVDALKELDRVDLFGGEVEIPWREDSSPRLTAASLTAMASSPGGEPELPPPPRVDTFASQHTDTSARERRGNAWRWVLAAVTACVAMGAAAVIVVKWPRPAVVPNSSGTIASAPLAPPVIDAGVETAAVVASSAPIPVVVAPKPRAAAPRASAPLRSSSTVAPASPPATPKPGPSFEPTIGD